MRSIATHGHEDHVGGIQFLLRDDDGIGHLRDDPLPIYGAKLTLGLARNRIEEAGLLGRCDMTPVADNETIEVGPFTDRVHPGHALGAARPCDRGAHSAGHRAALG